jgi:hypothetical protein
MSNNVRIAPQVNPERNLRTLARSAPHLDLPTQTFDPLSPTRSGCSAKNGRWSAWLSEISGPG